MNPFCQIKNKKKYYSIFCKSILFIFFCSQKYSASYIFCFRRIIKPCIVGLHLFHLHLYKDVFFQVDKVIEKIEI